jgi:hypothetical protein
MGPVAKFGGGGETPGEREEGGVKPRVHFGGDWIEAKIVRGEIWLSKVSIRKSGVWGPRRREEKPKSTARSGCATGRTQKHRLKPLLQGGLLASVDGLN